jgi:plasmid maintenance system antidote protein VapI
VARLTSPETLKAVMARQKLSVRKLATEAGCAPSFISHLRDGRKSSCTADLAARISDALGTDVIFLPDVSCGTSHSSRSASRCRAVSDPAA